MPRRIPRPVLILLAVAVAYFVRNAANEGSPPASAPAAAGEAAILAAFENRTSELVVEASGTVDRVLADDNEGSRHQRFVLKFPSGHTVLVSHNIDLAPRIENLQRGDLVEFRGQYEWNERGGVVHWTHHDPQGRRPGGWLRHGGDEYR